ncbi:MAG: hypothetical protein R2798_06755 [Chitinophagales bacterium]|nr:hypothetical protein [Bacteroidota bacterium]
MIRQSDSLAQNGAWEEAALIAEHAAFESDNDSLLATALWQKANILQQQFLSEEAYNTLLRIPTNVFSPNEKYYYHSRLAALAYAQNDMAKARFHLLNADMQAKTLQLSDENLYLKALVYNGLEDWGSAEAAFVAWLEQHQMDTLISQQYYQVFHKKCLKSAKRASMMSTFVPGSGQVYVHKPLAGMVSFSTISAFLAFGVISFIDGYYFTGFFTGFGLAQAFYRGGTQQAADLAERYNKRLIEKLQTDTKAFILEVESENKTE